MLNYPITRIYPGPPVSPVKGDYYTDTKTYDGYMYDGVNWNLLLSSGNTEIPNSLEPTKEQLEKYSALKQAWDEYLIIRKLLGL